MAFRNFRVGPRKGLRLAECAEVPNVMVISGPNGVGKSTLLELLQQSGHQAEPSTKIGFVGAYRPWRKGQLGMAHLFEPYRYADLISMNQLPGWSAGAPGGLHYINQTPRIEGVDESQSLVKMSIAKIEVRFSSYLTTAYKVQGQQIAQGSIPDVYEPLQSLTAFLLPHLRFEEVDCAATTNVRCLFRRRDGDADDLIDIDDLSSGEKAVIALFLPYLEEQMLRRLEPAAAASVMGTTLLDEPELHLHPSLQVALLDYFRRVSFDRNHQFILTTHSPTLLDATRDDELFVLLPVAVAGDRNQLLRVSDSAERLEAIRELTGSTHFITRARPIVFVEGEVAESKRVSDERLIEILLPESHSWSVVPRRGKKDVVNAARLLRQVMQEGGLSVPVFALVDLDQGDRDEEWVIQWPVAMIENLLLDTAAMWRMLAPFAAETGINDEVTVEKTLRDIAARQRQNEIDLRVARDLGFFKAWLAPSQCADIDSALESLRDDLDRWSEAAKTSGGVAGKMKAAEEEVQRIVNERRELEAFRGKPILDDFYEQRVKRILPKKAFLIQLAILVKESERLSRLTSVPFTQVRQFIPLRAVELVAEIKTAASESLRQEAEALYHDLSSARENWTRGVPDRQDRAALRSRMVALARAVRSFDQTGAWHRDLLTSTAAMSG